MKERIAACVVVPSIVSHVALSQQSPPHLFEFLFKLQDNGAGPSEILRLSVRLQLGAQAAHPFCPDVTATTVE